MRYIWLVAVREYAENAKTKGFWISLLLFPIIIMASFSIARFLEKATPTRNFVLVDQSGSFREVAERGLERLHQRDVLQALGEYIGKNSVQAEQTEAAGLPEGGLADLPYDVNEMMEKFSRRNAEMLDKFIDSGGVETALSMVPLKEDAPEFEEPRRRFRRVELPEGVDPSQDMDALAQELRPYLRGQQDVDVEGERGDLFAAILIPADIESQIDRPLMEQLQRGEMPSPEDMAGTSGKTRGIQYWTSNLADDDLKDEVERVLNGEIRRREYVDRGIDAGVVRSVQNTEVPFVTLSPKKEVGQEKADMGDRIRQWAPVGFVYLLWISIFTISQMLLNNTIEEKSNKIIEVLLSSVTAGELMMGKLLGIAGIGLTMMAAWIGSLVAILAFKAGRESEIAQQAFEVLQTSGLLPAFAAYFLVGYLLYAGAFLAVGSLCNTLKEAQNLMGVIMVVMMVPLFTMMFIPKDPNGTLATIMSWIPLYTPFVMMNRAAADPPLFDVIGTGILVVLFAALVLWASGKIFRLAILRTGQPPKLLELLRWVRSSE